MLGGHAVNAGTLWLTAVAIGLVITALAIRLWGSRLSVVFQLGYLLRCQIILFFTPIVILVLSFIASGVFSNLVNVDGVLQAGLVSWVVLGSSWLCLAMVIVVLDHAQERFQVDFQVPQLFWNWSATLFAIPPLLLMVRVYFSSSGMILPGLALGAMGALIATISIDALVHYLDPPAMMDTPRRFIFLSTSYPTSLGRRLGAADPLASVPRWLFRWMRHLGPGYLAPNERPYADQMVVAASVLATFAVYTSSFYLGWRLLANGHRSTGVPALAYLQFLILSFVIVTAGAAFFLDRYRVPLLVTILAYSIAVSMLFDTDHYWFAARPEVNNASSSHSYSDGVAGWLSRFGTGTDPNSILRFNGKPVVVVVCASGGGIEAAAWTVRVLKGLRHDLGEEYGPALTRSIRLISSTSGGSIGSLFFTQSFFTAKDAPSDDQFDKIWKASITSSLDATGWGLVHPDFARLFAPWALWMWVGKDVQARKIDRGWALEQSWRVALADPANAKGYIDSNLSDWRDSVAAGILPGTVFNSTLVETGDPLLLSSVNLALPTGSRAVVFGQTQDAGADISNVTAARLSATFPYVSPVARGLYTDGQNDSSAPASQMHVADGGYYDNFGVTVAVEWIRQIIASYHDKLGKVVVIVIDAFPETDPLKHKTLKTRPQHFTSLNPHSGWGSEVLGPVKTMLNSRSATQLGRDVIEFDLLQNDSDGSAGGRPASSPVSLADAESNGFVNIIPFVASHSGPLSWQLSAQDTRAIEKDWNSDDIRKQIELLKRCLKIGSVELENHR
jgi:hypothetical protein